LALHTNFQALRKAEVRRMPKRRSSQNSFNTKFAERFFYALREKGHKEGLEQRGFSPSIKQLQRVALILSCTHHACTIGRVGFSAEPSVRIMRYRSITLKSAVGLCRDARVHRFQYPCSQQVAALHGCATECVCGARVQRETLVQQPCSNPSKYPETLRKASTRKYSDLQVFCKLQKALEKYRAAFARRRSGVQIPSAPLLECGGLQVKSGQHGCFSVSAHPFLTTV
jgi:uncharacterized metal-binding protein